MSAPTLLTLALLAMLVLAGCGNDDDQGNLEIIGSYTDNFGGSHTIIQASWTQDFGPGNVFILNITSFSNSLDYLVGENDVSNGASAGTFNRIDWTTFQSSLYFCTTAFSQPTEADALAAGEGVADATDPSTGGCSGFSWSRLDPVTP